MRVSLMPLEGGRSLELVQDLTLVGRQEGCDLVLEHKSVSKIHCVLVKSDGLLYVRDLGSTNGTRVNGQRVRRASLSADDQILIAKFGFRIIVEREGAPARHCDPYDRTINDLAPSHESNGHRENGEGCDSAVLGPGAVHNNHLPDAYPDERR